MLPQEEDSGAWLWCAADDMVIDAVRKVGARGKVLGPRDAAIACGGAGGAAAAARSPAALQGALPREPLSLWAACRLREAISSSQRRPGRAAACGCGRPLASRLCRRRARRAGAPAAARPGAFVSSLCRRRLTPCYHPPHPPPQMTHANVGSLLVFDPSKLHLVRAGARPAGRARHVHAWRPRAHGRPFCWLKGVAPHVLHRRAHAC